MMATKEQERKALEQIREIVEGLGEGSYVAAAFDGCFDLAESNITNDFCESYKRRFENEYAKRHESEEKLCGRIAELKADKEEVELKYNRLKSVTFDGDEISDLKEIIFNSGRRAEDAMKEAATRIVENAENPASTEFKKAVEEHRTYKVDYEKCLRLREKAAKMPS